MWYCWFSSMRLLSCLLMMAVSLMTRLLPDFRSFLLRSPIPFVQLLLSVYHFSAMFSSTPHLRHQQKRLLERPYRSARPNPSKSSESPASILTLSLFIYFLFGLALKVLNCGRKVSDQSNFCSKTRSTRSFHFKAPTHFACAA
jgi:hypothetical protein